MHPLGYHDIPSEERSAPIFNVRHRKIQPKTLKLSLDKLNMESKMQNGDATREVHEKSKRFPPPRSPLVFNTPGAKTTHTALPKVCVGTTQVEDNESYPFIRKSPSCLSVKLMKNAVKRNCQKTDKPNAFYDSKPSNICLSNTHPKHSRSVFKVSDNVRLARLHSKLSCISNEVKSVVTSSTSRSDDQIVLHSTTPLLHESSYSIQCDVSQRRSQSPVANDLKPCSSSLSVCSHATDLAMIMPEISVETNINYSSRTEILQCNNESASRLSPQVKSIADEEEKPICMSQHSIRLRSHNPREPIIDFGRRVKVPRADLSRIRLAEAPGLKALDQLSTRQFARKHTVFKEIEEDVHLNQMANSKTVSSISYMILYMSVLCGIGLMMLAYYL